jgi:hypothetical protein
MFLYEINYQLLYFSPPNKHLLNQEPLHTIRIIGFEDFVHHPEFKQTRKHNVW